ncbi:hypothetical protein HanXRQr2_Chr11g0510741 [Helianthus annuus]|uniref:Uncharacterized protein n=1 Tax=Helianthus annuus TaxID=4232 RepID=A0A9K3N1L9_HELAN|nr:hypothetical protein HanXRQr2_Chr11g0510741 [Helianthus annuus]KAJ0876745.1 hypothetical protein HanPSC8_Chr11g0491981 [Helianthus annuus]
MPPEYLESGDALPETTAIGSFNHDWGEPSRTGMFLEYFWNANNNLPMNSDLSTMLAGDDDESRNEPYRYSNSFLRSVSMADILSKHLFCKYGASSFNLKEAFGDSKKLNKS